MRESVDKVNHTVKAGKAEKSSHPGDPDILDLVHAVMHLYRSHQYQTLRDGPHGVTHMDSKVLGFFARHPGATQSELAVHSGRDKAQLARLVAGLRERGLLAAAADAADRRSVHLSLTAEGQAVQRSLQQQARRQTTRALGGFSAAERAQLQALLERVKGNLDVGSPPDEARDRLAPTEMVREYLRDHRQIENAELRELLGLGNSPSAQVEASRYLKKWSQPDGFLDRQRVRGTWVYTLSARA